MPVRKTRSARPRPSLAAALADCSAAAAAPVFDGHFPISEVRREQREDRRRPRRQHVADGQRRRKTTSPGSTPTAGSKNSNSKESKRASGIAVGPEGRMWVTADQQGRVLRRPRTRRHRAKRRRSPTSRPSIRSSPGPTARCGSRRANNIVHFTLPTPTKAQSISVPELQPERHRRRRLAAGHRRCRTTNGS